ncbi:hypothetical protein DL764_010962 [Monosporascus ibericus]|uniref:Uncharacterized protein n=1 Tax=Monosporascus ibericus TaxID=155417 RepID=A0A4Q4STR0_9PEZI|nr:hypothetical protein DL764_010962 [Monosporascus ibericus]
MKIYQDDIEKEVENKASLRREIDMDAYLVKLALHPSQRAAVVRERIEERPCGGVVRLPFILNNAGKA